MDPIPLPVTDTITAIDTGMAGQRELNAVYVLAGDEPCLIEAGPEADGPMVRAGLGALGIGPEDLAHVVVTHIHVDHAGGAGALLEAYPHATVWVHERGATHLADPARLVASTARTYGEDRMRTLYGDVRPIDPDRIRAVGDGDRILMGERALLVVHTPGHASHHMALFDESSGAVWTGEAIGTYLPWASAFRPALPPPETDVDLALASVRAIGALRPSHLLTSHFGATPDVEPALARAAASISRWSERVRHRLEDDPAIDDEALAMDLRGLAAEEFTEQSGRPLGPELDRYDTLGSIRMNGQGLARYWRRRAERGSGLN